MNNTLPKYMTRNGPGDTSKPSEINTDAWFGRPVNEYLNDYKWYMTSPNVLKKGSIGQQAKDQEIFFCDIPFSQVYIEMGGHYAACCFGAEADGQNGLPSHNVNNTSLVEWMKDSTYMNEIRSEMLDPNSKFETTKKTCKRCIDDENRYGRSRRTACMKIHTNDQEYWKKIEQIAQMFKLTGEWEFESRILEVQLKVYGDECNLDCYMCMHDNSTIRQKVALEGVWNQVIFNDQSWSIPIENNYGHTNFKHDNNKGDKAKSFIDQTLAIAPYINTIKIIGGEPLIMKKHYELLDKLIKADEAKNIVVKYQTNLTETKAGKHNIFDYIPKFKKVFMVVSVDGIGKTIEYMRRRCNWNQIIKNTTYCRRYDNVNVDFNGLVSFLSVMRFYEVIDWCLENPIIDTINWAMLETPKHLRVNNLPKKIKDNLIPKYKQWPDIQAALELPAEEDIDIQEVFDYLLKQDEYYKGTKWEMNLFNVFPELKEFYKEK